MRTSVRIVVPAALSLLAACAGRDAAAPRAVAGVVAPASAIAPASMVAPADVQRSVGRDAYEIVQFLRPEWLRPRGLQSFGESGHVNTSDLGVSNVEGSDRRKITGPDDQRPQVVVYLDQARLGGKEALREISRTAVHSIEYVGPATAHLRFGPGHTHGVILVVTR